MTRPVAARAARDRELQLKLGKTPSLVAPGDPSRLRESDRVGVRERLRTDRDE
jgi:hypothetical protein